MICLWNWDYTGMKFRMDAYEIGIGSAEKRKFVGMLLILCKEKYNNLNLAGASSEAYFPQPVE